MIGLDPKKSLFIAIEGIDFSGKTTLVERIKSVIQNDELISNYFDKVIYTKEPNSEISEICTQTRKIATEHKNISDLTRALIFFANRSEHVEKVIQPARNKGGCLIICDRFYLSTLVYQIKKNPSLLEWARHTQSTILPEAPDITYLIKINKELFLSRYKNKNREKNYLDQLTYEKFEEMSSLYEWFITQTNDLNIGTIKCLEEKSGDVDPIILQIQKDIREKIKSFLNHQHPNTYP